MSKLIKANGSREESRNIHPIALQPLKLVQDTAHAGKEEEDGLAEIEQARTRIINDAEKMAEKIIIKAEEERDRLVSAVEVKRVKMKRLIAQEKERSIQEGREIGFQEGERQGFDKWKDAIATATSIVKVAHSDYDRYLEGAETVIINLAGELAAKVLGEKLETTEGWGVFIQQALQEVKNHPDVSVYVHPDRYEETVQKRDEWQALLTHVERLRFFPAPDLKVNDCVIETPAGRLEVSLQVQLQQLQSGLNELLNEENTT